MATIKRSIPLALFLIVCAAAQVMTQPPVEIIPDVVYGHKDGLAMTFDVIKPKANANGAAVIFMVSGGWVSPYSPPPQTAERFKELLEKGFTLIAVRHGGSPKYLIPDIVSDVRRAVRFIRHNAKQWGVDPNRLGVFGGSAGGHLALVLGTASDNGDPNAKEDFMKESDRVASVVAYFPPVDLRPLARGLNPQPTGGTLDRFPALNFEKEKAADYSPIVHVSPDDPPTLLIHGDKDDLVPVNNSKLIYEAFQKNNVKSQLIIIEGAGHGFRGDDAKRASAAMVAWFEQTLLKGDLKAQSQDQTAPAPQAKNDYGKAESWLCRPGRQDACAVDLTTTIVAANGKLTEEKWKANPNAPIDCFYVYPTVSNDPTPNSDMTAGPEERSVVQHQFARFGSQCRPYAPLYRQVTLTALRANLSGRPMAADRSLAYNDVLDAWNYYLEHDNQGRGVVLIGHSQGSGVLTQLIKNEIDGKPIQDRVVSALLLGWNVAVPKGEDVGGSFQKMPLCRAANQTGCVISYVTFRENSPPPANSFFGRPPGEGMVVACTNPAELSGGGGELHAYLASGRSAFTSSAAPKPWVTPEQPIKTPFVSVPGLLSAKCVSNEHGSYLAVKVHGDPADPRADDIAGDVVVNGQVQANWGLHLIDVQVAIGDLVEIVGQQAKAYQAKNKKK